jgi:hypothetical protein
MRFCTQELKIQTAGRYIRRELRWVDYDTALGLRADEPHRVAKLAPHISWIWERPVAPLSKLGITLEDVRSFWDDQPFDLNIPEGLGNCDFCFLKGVGQRSKIVLEHPEVPDWWIEQERLVSEKQKRVVSFSKRLPLTTLVENARKTCNFDDDRFPECRCTD